MKKRTAAVYLRVSTDKRQSTASQETELESFVSQRGWVYLPYRDAGQSGAKEDRPALRQLLQDCRKRKVDVVVVWAMDRLARSLHQLLALIEEFQALGIDFVSYQQQMDTSTPTGRLTYQVLGAVAEWERSMLVERIKAGLRNAKKKGQKLGRPALRGFTADEKQEIKTAYSKGASVRGLSIERGTTQWMISQIIGTKRPYQKNKTFQEPEKCGPQVQ